MIRVTEKSKVFNAAYPGEAEQQLSDFMASLLRNRLPGYNYYNLQKNLTIEWEYPDIDFPDYRYCWIEATEKLAAAISKHLEQFPDY